LHRRLAHGEHLHLVEQIAQAAIEAATQADQGRAYGVDQALAQGILQAAPDPGLLLMTGRKDNDAANAPIVWECSVIRLLSMKRSAKFTYRTI